MENKLLTKRELAERWQVSVRTIDNWIKEGIVSICEKIPVPRFTESYVQEMEGIKLDKFSPIQMRKLEIELARIRKENEQLKASLLVILRESSKVLEMAKE